MCANTGRRVDHAIEGGIGGNDIEKPQKKRLPFGSRAHGRALKKK